ncbi:MAG TPA: hypothetical protein PK431_16165 [Chitinophagales bacterium]|nr:hypothetical protein [Chitinophagales bacterium]
MQYKYPFVEFDSMCLISIDSKDFADAIDSIYVENNHALINDYMHKPLNYSSRTCKQNDIKSIIDFFSSNSKYEYDVACEPIFRNAILCYNKSKLVATTLICFDCQVFLFQPCKTNTDCTPFIEDIKIIKDVFEKNGLKAKHAFEQPIVPLPPR